MRLAIVTGLLAACGSYAQTQMTAVLSSDFAVTDNTACQKTSPTAQSVTATGIRVTANLSCAASGSNRVTAVIQFNVSVSAATITGTPTADPRQSNNLAIFTPSDPSLTFNVTSTVTLTGATNAPLTRIQPGAAGVDNSDFPTGCQNATGAATATLSCSPRYLKRVTNNATPVTEDNFLTFTTQDSLHFSAIFNFDFGTYSLDLTPQFTERPCGCDAVSLTGISPPAGPLDPGSSQQFIATANYTLKSSTSAAILLLLVDQTGKRVAISTPVSIRPGTGTTPVTIPALRLPSSGALTLNAVLRPSGFSDTVTPAATYTLGAVTVTASITLDTVQPANGESLIALAGKLPPFFGAGQYTYNKKASVNLLLLDDAGNILGTAGSQSVASGTNAAYGKQRPFLTIAGVNSPAFTIPPNADVNTVVGKLHLQAILIDDATVNTVARSNVIDYPVIVGAKIKADLGYWQTTGLYLSNTPTIVPLPPAVQTNLALTIANAAHITLGSTGNLFNSLAPRNEAGVVLTIDLARGAAAVPDVVVSVTNRGAAQRIAILQSVRDLTSFPLAGPQSGKQLVFEGNFQPTSGDTLVVTPRLTTASGQQVLFTPITLPLEAIAVVSKKHTPPCTNENGDCLIAGTNHFEIGLEAITRQSGAFVHRRIVDQTTNLPFNPAQGATSSYTDTFDATAVLYVGMCAYYTLNYTIGGDGGALSDACFYNVQQNLSIPNGNTPTLASAGGSVNNIASTSPQTTQSSVNDQDLHAISQVFDSGGALASERPRASSTASVPAGFLGINRTWGFSPPIAAGGTLTADLSLNYAAADFPDDPNFDESKLQMISYDPAATQFTSYATTVDTQNHVATAHVDGLAKWYSLAVFPPFSKSFLALAAAPSGFAVVNTDANAASAALNSFLSSDGSPVFTLTQTIAAGAQFQGPSSDLVEMSDSNTGLAAVGLLDNGQAYDVLAPSTPAESIVLTSVEYSSSTSTELRLSNMASHTRTVNLTLYSNDGSAVDTFSAQVPGRGTLIRRAEDVFAQMPATFSGYATGSSTAPLAASELIFTTRTAAALPARPLNTAATHLVSPYLGGNAPATLSLVNTGTQTANLTLKAFLATGASAGPAVALQIRSGQRIRQDLSAIFSIAASTAGSFTVDSDRAGVAGDVSVQDPSFAGGYSYSFPLSAAALPASVLPLATGAATVAIANPNSSAANTTLVFRGQDGSLAGSASVSVPANGTLLNTISSFLPGVSASTSGSLVVQASQALVVLGSVPAPSGEIGAYLALPAIAAAVKSGPPPQINAGGITNAAAAKTTLARSALATLYWSGYTGAPAVAQSLPLPYSLGGVSVTVGGIPAPLYYVDANQINFQVPKGVPAGSSAQVIVTANGQPSPAVPVAIADYAVAVFGYFRTAQSFDPIVVHSSTNTLVSSASPAVPGETLIAYATGAGKLNDPPADGGAASSSPLAMAVDTPTVTVGGSNAQVLFAGLTPGLVGVLQLNITLPATLPSGGLPLIVKFPGDASPSMNLAVQGNISSTPKLTLSAASLAFGSVTVGQTKDLPLTVQNTGTAALSVSSIAAAGSGFSVTTATSFTLQPNASQTITVRFAPGSAASFNGTLTIASNDSASPAAVSLSGTGVAALAPVIGVTPTALDFGTVAAGQTKDLTVTINNRGTAVLTINSGASSNARFTLVNPTPFQIGPGSFQFATIRFAPVSSGAQSGAITLNSNDPATPAVTINVTGTGSGGGPTDTTLSVDGGSFDSEAGYPNGAATAYFLVRLTPPSYPATLKNVLVYFSTRSDGVTLNQPIGILSATNTNGSAALTGLSAFDRVNGSINARDVFLNFPVTQRTITSGDFVVGFVVQNPAGVFPADLDAKPPSKQRSFTSSDGVNFGLLDSLGVPGNLAIRAVVSVGN